MKTVFFDEVIANSELATNQTFVDSWNLGGYYATQITKDLMLITLNGIYPFTSNEVESNNGTL